MPRQIAPRAEPPTIDLYNIDEMNVDELREHHLRYQANMLTALRAARRAVRKLLAGPAAPQSRFDRERLLANYIMTHCGSDPKKITVRGAARATGIPRATVGRLDAWREFKKWRSSGKVSEIRTRALTDKMIAVIAGSADDPAEIVAAEELKALYTEQQRDGASDHWGPVSVDSG